MLLVYTIKSIKSTDYALVYKKLIFAGKIPLAYAIDPSGRCVLLKRNEYGGFIVKIDLGKSVEKILTICLTDYQIYSLVWQKMIIRIYREAVYDNYFTDYGKDDCIF